MVYLFLSLRPLPFICLSFALCPSDFSCHLPRPSCHLPLPKPQRERVATLEKALQAVLGFGIRDGSGSGAGNGDDREQQQHQDHRAPHGRAGRAAGKVVRAG